LELGEPNPETASAIAQIGRRTDDRMRDVSEEVRELAESRLQAAGPIEQSSLRRLAEFVIPDRSDAVRTFGEPLPKELNLHSTTDCLSTVSAIGTEP
jgi:hypothetical protein